MDIAVLGTGRVGGTLGVRWAQKSHKIVYGTQEQDCEEVLDVLKKSGPNASAASVQEAVASCRVVLLAIPWDVTKEVLASIAPLDGKILLDCVNPIKPDFLGFGSVIGTIGNATDRRVHPGASVVKAFNTVSDATMVNPLYHGKKASMFYCGDDDEAKSVVHQLTEDLEMEPVDAGPLGNAAYLESLAMLYMHLAIFGGWGTECAFRFVKR